MSKKRYWFHVSSLNKGNEVIFLPRIPQTISTDCNGKPIEDSTTKRICVSDSISGCLVAIVDYRKFVYRTKNRIMAKAAKRVPDKKITGEHWLTSPTEFKLFKKLTNRIINKLKDGPCGNPDPESLKEQKQVKIYNKKILIKFGIPKEIA